MIPSIVVPTELSISNIEGKQIINLSPLTKNPDQHHKGKHTTIEISDLWSENRTTIMFLLDNTDLQYWSLKSMIIRTLEFQIKKISDEEMTSLYDHWLLWEFDGHMCNICLHKILKENIVWRYNHMFINASMVPEKDRKLISQVFWIKEYYYMIPSWEKGEDELPPGEC